MGNPQPLLQPEQLRQFEQDGFLLIPGFYDAARDIVPIQLGIYQIIGLVMERHGLNIDRPPFHPDHFDAGFMALVAHDRRYGSEVYDAVKQIPAFVRLTACERNERVYRQLRQTDAAGIAGGGSGIRIDIPHEEHIRAGWHQEYLFQLRSVDGVVFWSPLMRITPDLGPVVIAVGSHKDGIVPMYSKDRKFDRTGAYAYSIEGGGGPGRPLSHGCSRVRAGRSAGDGLSHPACFG